MEWMFLLGVATGMRSMTPIAVVCWFAWRGQLNVHDTWAFWAGNIISVVVFGLAAVGEYIGDTLPKAPNRTSLFPAAGRIIFGALCGAIVASAYLQPIAGGIVFGGVGAVVGTWGGLYARRALSGRLRHDLPVALFGSALAVILSVVAVREYVFYANKYPVRYRDEKSQVMAPPLWALTAHPSQEDGHPLSIAICKLEFQL